MADLEEALRNAPSDWRQRSAVQQWLEKAREPR